MQRGAHEAGEATAGAARWTWWGAPAALVFLAVLTFSTGLSGGFVLDDKFAVLGHPVVQGLAPVGEAFGLNFWGKSLDEIPTSFRPLTTLSYVLDRRLLGGSPFAAHVTSLLWYVGLVLAGWAFARRCVGAGAAFVAMAVFVVMPVHVENVSAVASRGDTLGLSLGILAYLAISPALRDGKPTSPLRVLGACASFGAALLCKENLAALPVLVALLIESRRRKLGDTSFVRAHMPSLALAAVLGIYLAWRLDLQPQMLSRTELDDVLVGAGVWERLGYGLDLLWRYATLVVAPVRLCSGRRFSEVFRPAHLSWTMLGGACVLVAAGYVSWRHHKRGRLPFVPAAVLSWLLVSGLVFPMPESMADRFLLEPTFFLTLAAGPFLLACWTKAQTRWQGARASILVALVGVQAILSARQARVWHDEGTLFSHAVRVCPDSLHNHFRYAEYLSEHGQTAEAVWHYGVVTAGKHAFPYEWKHPARDAESTLPAELRVREMHRLLGFKVAEDRWRQRFAGYLRSFGRQKEAELVASLPPETR